MSPLAEGSQWCWKEARRSSIPLACSRTSDAEQAHRHCSCMASWDQQELTLQQWWLKVEAPGSVWEEAEERSKKIRLGIHFHYWWLHLRYVANTQIRHHHWLAYVYLCECGSWQWECLWRWAERVWILLRCVCWWQDLRSWNIRTGSAAGGGVSVRIMTLWLHLRRWWSHCGGGRSVTPHRALVNCTAKR